MFQQMKGFVSNGHNNSWARGLTQAVETIICDVHASIKFHED